MKKYQIKIHKNEIKQKIKGKWIDVPEFLEFTTDETNWVQVVEIKQPYEFTDKHREKISKGMKETWANRRKEKNEKV